MNLYERTVYMTPLATRWANRRRATTGGRIYHVVGDKFAPVYRHGDLFYAAPDRRPRLRSHVAVTVKGGRQLLGIVADRQEGTTAIRVFNESNSIEEISDNCMVSILKIFAGFHQ